VKFVIKKEKSRKKVFHMGKKTAKCSLLILSALVIHTAPTVELLPPTNSTLKKREKGGKQILVVLTAGKDIGIGECILECG
jgi:hypothetical protein